MSAMEEAIQEFTTECEEMLERIAVNLTVIEKGDHTEETLSSIYRDMHTIKGSSQLFGFNQIGILAHAMEACLDPLRQGMVAINPTFVDCIYTNCDIISRLVASILSTGTETDENDAIGVQIPRLVELTLVPFHRGQILLKDQPPKLAKSESQSPKATVSSPPPSTSQPARPVEIAETQKVVAQTAPKSSPTTSNDSIKDTSAVALSLIHISEPPRPY